MAQRKSSDVAHWQVQYDRLRGRLAVSGWISDGYVQDRGPGAGGPCYQWTRKRRGKTVSVALSKEQYEWLRAAIAEWRQVQTTLKEMQRLSRQVLFETVPHPPVVNSLAKGFWVLCKCHSPVRGALPPTGGSRPSGGCLERPVLRKPALGSRGLPVRIHRPGRRSLLDAESDETRSPAIAPTRQRPISRPTAGAGSG